MMATYKKNFAESYEMDDYVKKYNVKIVDYKFTFAYGYEVKFEVDDSQIHSKWFKYYGDMIDYIQENNYSMIDYYFDDNVKKYQLDYLA